MKLFVAALCLTAVSALSLPVDLETEWSLFKANYGKVYKSVIEESQRKAIFTQNFNFIKEHNQQYELGLTSYFLKINQFADTTSEERQYLKGFKGFKYTNTEEFKSNSSLQAPDSIDWRQKGAVTRVKNQEQCGSCWAFATTGSLEGQYFLKHHKLVELSEQNLVDCAPENGWKGCDGFDAVPAYQYIQKNGGIDSEASYPYTGRDGSCRYNPANKVTTISGIVNVQVGNENQLKEAVGNVGPVAIAIDASSQEFDFYGGGIFNPAGCSSVNLDHAVLAVGYGSQNGQAYWLVKNSWSANWGESGYIKMIRNNNNHCGVATEGVYPKL